MSDEGIKDRVKEKYGQAALRVIATGTTSCCGSTSSASGCDPVTSNLYGHDQTADLPEQAVAASLGCGNPTALAELAAGETVLDLGSGGGIDVLLSAKRVGPAAEAFRVLKPGGRLAVSDVVVRGEVPSAIRRSVELWIGCIAGALEEGDYRARLAKAGFEAIEVEPTRIYRTEDAREFLDREGIDADAIAPAVDGKFMSAFVRARKPSAA